MPDIDLELQMKFLADLDSALDDAVHRYAEQSPEKLDELAYMKKEVTRARQVVRKRLNAIEPRSFQTDEKSGYFSVAAQ